MGNILGTINTGTTRQSSQSYTYDDRYQLVSAVGTTTTTLGGLTLEENHYTQRYRYDVIGNMTAKTSTNRIMPSVETPAHLNYDLTYTYDPARPHQATRIGELAYRYDPNGNLTQVYDPTTTNPATPAAPPPWEDLGPYRGSAPEAFGRYRWNESAEPEEPIAGYRWNEDNRLVQSTTGDNVVTDYRYDTQGTRRVKYSRGYGETLYADRMYQEHVGTTATAAVTARCVPQP